MVYFIQVESAPQIQLNRSVSVNKCQSHRQRRSKQKRPGAQAKAFSVENRSSYRLMAEDDNITLILAGAVSELHAPLPAFLSSVRHYVPSAP